MRLPQQTGPLLFHVSAVLLYRAVLGIPFSAVTALKWIQECFPSRVAMGELTVPLALIIFA